MDRQIFIPDENTNTYSIFTGLTYVWTGYD